MVNYKLNVKKQQGEQKSKSHKNEEIENLENQIKRVLADYQNLQKRTEEEKANWIKIANKNLLLRLFPVLDTLMLAQNHVKDEGLDLSVKQFLQALEKEGVERIQTLGESFDPKEMEVVEVREGEEGEVLSEIRAGYKLFGEVVRPAQVIAGKKKINQEEEEKTKEELNTGDYM